jgi:hypothetical protein
MTGMILDAVLMLLLVAALGYGVRLEKKLTQLRAGQLAFAGAVTELNAACGRAENALSSLRASGEEADLLHDRILKARALKTDLEQLIARGGKNPSVSPRSLSSGRAELGPGGSETPPHASHGEETRRTVSSPSRLRDGEGDREAVEGLLSQHRPQPPAPDPDDRAFRMAALAERIQGMAAPAQAAAGAGNVQAILHALTANQAAKQSLNRAKASLDDDLFAA